MPQPNVSKKWKVSNVSRKRARTTTSDDDSAQAISGRFFYQFYSLNWGELLIFRGKLNFGGEVSRRMKKLRYDAPPPIITDVLTI